MRVIPVIDLKQGQVVHAVAGQRDHYRPIVSMLCDDPSAAAVGTAFRRLGFTEAYVADLDAIGGGAPDYEAYERLLACDLRLLVDAGLTTAERAAELAAFSRDSMRLEGLIVGLESVASSQEIAASLEIIPPSRLVFSLDLRDGLPMTHLPEWQTFSAERIASEVVRLGVRRLIVLDIARVGVGTGVSTLALCQRLKQSHAHLEIISGGGVRHLDDLERMAAAGCEAALVASALHDGRLIASDLELFC